MKRLLSLQGGKQILPFLLLLPILVLLDRWQTDSRQTNPWVPVAFIVSIAVSARRSCAPAPHLLTLTRTHTDNPAGSGLVQGSWRPDSSFWSWLPQGHSDSHPFTQTQGLLRDCHGLTAVALALEEEGETRSWAGVLGRGSREEAGLGRVRLAFTEFFCSLRMMRSTQGWSRGAQSWRPLTVVNLESGQREWSCGTQLPGRPWSEGQGWGPHLATCFRVFIRGIGLARRRERRCGWVSPGADGGDEVRHSPLHNSHNGRHSAAILEEEVAKGSHDVPRDGALVHSQAAVFSIVGTTQSWERK